VVRPVPTLVPVLSLSLVLVPLLSTGIIQNSADTNPPLVCASLSPCESVARKSQGTLQSPKHCTVHSKLVEVVSADEFSVCQSGLTMRYLVDLHNNGTDALQSKFGTSQRLVCENFAVQDMFIIEPISYNSDEPVKGHLNTPLLFIAASGVVGKAW
jgi:hypothetical protein